MQAASLLPAAYRLPPVSRATRLVSCLFDLYASESHIHMHMRTTLIIDDELLEKARRLSGLKEKTAIVHAGLEALITRESARRLAALGGSEPQMKAVPRRRSRTPR